MQFLIQVGGKILQYKIITKGNPKALIKLKKNNRGHQLKVIKKYSKKL